MTYNPDEDEIQQTYTLEPHSPKKVKIFSWEVCKYCGLVYLRNPFTQWAIKMGCNNRLHKDYKHQHTMAGGYN